MNASEMTMANEEKARELAIKSTKYIDDNGKEMYNAFVEAALQEMAAWKDKQYKTAYVVTRIDLHYDEVERVFFDKEKAKNYCKQFNENENEDRRNTIEIEVS
jgi:hypothetical protein